MHLHSHAMGIGSISSLYVDHPLQCNDYKNVSTRQAEYVCRELASDPQLPHIVSIVELSVNETPHLTLQEKRASACVRKLVARFTDNSS